MTSDDKSCPHCGERLCGDVDQDTGISFSGCANRDCAHNVCHLHSSELKAAIFRRNCRRAEFTYAQNEKHGWPEKDSKISRSILLASLSDKVSYGKDSIKTLMQKAEEFQNAHQ